MMTTAMERIADDEASRASVPEMAAYLKDLFGPGLTAVIVGVDDADRVGQWARAESIPGAETVQRLRTAYHVAWLLRQVESAQVVQSWFMGMNPYLDDQAPALMIGKDPGAVLLAARLLVVGG
jgi:hypothetical protein